MNKRGPDKRMLDTIGQKLIESRRLPESDIDKIVANPDLFILVQKRIAANETSAKTVFEPLSVIQKNSAVFAGVTVMVIALVSIASLLRTANEPHVAMVVSVSAEMPETARPNLFPPLRKGSDPTPGRAANREATGGINAEKAVFKQPVRLQRPKVAVQAEGEFYAISSASGPDETGGDNRIIRVDMPRSSLFAMGVNVPLENGADTVKADLLVGPDGVTRAIRVVR